MLMSTKYYRLWNAVNKNAWLMKDDDINEYIKGKTGICVSTYYYNQTHYDKFQKTKSVAGITDVKTNQIWFDFDSEDNIDLAKNDAISTITQLEEKGFTEENYNIYYSGNRGFHIIVQLDKELTRKQVENIISKFSKSLPTLDSSMYDWNQVLRGVNTKHEATGLYKISLTRNELFTLNLFEIRKLAITDRPFVLAQPGILSLDLLKSEIKEKIKVLPVTTFNDPLKIKELDFTSKPNGWLNYKWSIANGRFEIGKRNHSFMVIASTCRALKYGRDHTAAICLAADKLHCEITGDTEADESALEREVLDVVFGSYWNGGQYSVENDIELRNYCEKNGFKIEKDENVVPVINIQDVNTSFKDFVKNIDKNTIKTGIKRLDDAVPITIGMNLGIVGSASSGKTALALEILKHTSMQGVVSVIASLDMHRTRLYEKVLYKVSHDVYKKTLSREELYKTFQADDDNELVAEVKKQYGNVYFYDRSRPTVEDLRKFILTVEAQTGKKVKLLMVDYFERIGSDVSDATASSLKVANELQDLLNDLNLAVVTLVQPNKFSLSGGPDTPILSYTAIKGSSFLYQSFRSIISIWRPFFTPKTKHLDKFMEMAILKNDLGELDHFKFNWEGKTGTITDMSEEQEFTYSSYLEEKKDITAPEKEEQSFGQFRRS